MKIKHRVRFWEQIVAWRIAGLPMLNKPGHDYYAHEQRPDILSEDERGELYAPAAVDGYWEPFKPWKPRHIRAALASRRVRLINWVEFG